MAESALTGVKLSERLGTLKPFRFMVDDFSVKLPRNHKFGTFSWLMPTWLMLAIPWYIATYVEWRVVIPWQQYLGVFPGDVFLSIAIGRAVFLLSKHLPMYSSRRWYQSWQWQVWSATFGLGFAAIVAVGEYTNAIYRYIPEAAYTLAQLFSPTSVFHYGIIVVVGYVLWAAVLPALVHLPREFWRSKLAIAALIVLWMVCAMYLDNVLPRPDLNNVHPLNGGWFGPLGLQFWHYLFG